MAEYSNLSATINAQIRANGVQAITGPVLNAVLAAMVNVLGDGYRLKGVAAPADNPGSPDNRVAYLAAQDGTYTNFGGLVVSGEVALLLWDSAWTKETLFSIDTAVTPGSGHLVTSGAVDDALTTLAGNIAAAYMRLVPAATEGNLAEFDNAGQVRDAGLATSDVATKNGHYPDLFAGFAGNLVDTRSAGTRQSFAFRQSGGDGVNYITKILGRTEAWNQLVGPSDTQVTIPSGHLYYAIINGTASVGTSDGTPISVTGGVDIVVDLTLEGLGLTTAAQFRALHPLPYYNYNAGELKNNAATGLETTGFNQFPSLPVNRKAESWPAFDATQCARVFANTEYHIHHDNLGVTNWRHIYKIYDLNGNEIKQNGIFISTQGSPYYNSNANIAGFVDAVDNTNTDFRFEVNVDCYVFFGFGSGAVASGTTISNFCINLSDASRNGTYEPYWKREIVLGLNNLACHDEDNNAVVVNGLDGVGTSQDELIVENGWGTKINKRFAEVDLGDLNWDSGGGTSVVGATRFRVQNMDAKALADNNTIPSCISTKYLAATANATYTGAMGICANGSTLYLYDPAFNSYTAAQVKAALAGVKLRYELATPKVLTLDNPIPALIEVDNLGTEKRLPEDTADNPQAPFECDSNYSVSTANLVRLLNL